MGELTIGWYSKAESGTDKKNLVNEILSLQSTLLRNRDRAKSEDGFLISRLEKSELNHLFEIGAVLWAKTNNSLVGYLLITPIFEFTDLFEGGEQSVGKFSAVKKIEFSEFDYLFQIGISLEMKGRGIGKSLIDALFRKTEKNLLTDVLIEPVANDVSLRFFKKNGFHEIGILELGEYRDFGKLKSKVLIWEKSKRQSESE